MHQFVIPIHHVNWSTRSVLEGISQKYKPKQIFVVTSDQEIKILKEKSKFWNIKNLNLLMRLKKWYRIRNNTDRKPLQKL